MIGVLRFVDESDVVAGGKAVREACALLGAGGVVSAMEGVVEGADEAVLGDETVAGHVGSEFRQGDLGEVVLPRPF